MRFLGEKVGGGCCSSLGGLDIASPTRPPGAVDAPASCWSERAGAPRPDRAGAGPLRTRPEPLVYLRSRSKKPAL